MIYNNTMINKIKKQNCDTDDDIEHDEKGESEDVTFNMPPMSSIMQQIAESMDILYLIGEVQDQKIAQIINAILIIENRNIAFNDFSHPITLVINSPGGELASGFMLCDVIDTIKTPVKTVGLGLVASAAFMIYMSGDQGLREATKNTQFMSHRLSGAIVGSFSNMMQQSKEINQVHKRLIDHYKRCTQLPKDVIENELLCEYDVWLSASQCKKYNIVDKLIPLKSRKNKNREE